MDTLLLVDGNALMHRAFHALPPFKTKEGLPTQVVYGFLSMVYKSITDFSPTYLIICFDTPKPTFRNELFKEYQIKRPKLTDEFKKQIPLVKESLNLGKIFYVEKEGFEADDLIGTITKKFNNKMKILILSGDRDILQLVNKNTFVVSPQMGASQVKIYDIEGVIKEFMIFPWQIADFKALVGDQSDNYPGAKGIGPKTASFLLKKFKTIENLFKNFNSIEDKKLRKILKENKENIFLAKKLAMIVSDVPIEIDLKKAKFQGFNQKLKDFLIKLEMISLVKRIFNYPYSLSKKTINDDKIDKRINISQIKLF